MSYTIRKNSIKSIRPGDSAFLITDGFISCHRASFEISKSCPAEYQSLIITAINAGWIKPVAHITERKLLFIGLDT